MITKIVLLASLAAIARAQVAYTIEVLPSPPGMAGFFVQDVDGLGPAVGCAQLPSWRHKAVLWDVGESVALPDPLVATWMVVAASAVSSTYVVGSGWHQPSNT